VTISLVVRGKLRDRLIDLSPRAFEFFAGDLLEFLGLASVAVTRQAGDGGIDAVCTMVSGGLFRVPAGVQVKRFRKPVGRPDIDKFVGSLANRFACGIFITTAAFTRASLEKAARSIPHVSTVDGDQITDVLYKNRIGITPRSASIDEEYFQAFESRVASLERSVREAQPSYRVITPDDDLVSLRALSYALHVDTTTIRDWIDRGRLYPDSSEGLYFRRRCIAEIRQTFGLGRTPSSGDEWLDAFMRFVARGQLNKSYKPVLLLAMLELATPDGTIDEDALVTAFWDFYRSREAAGLVVEARSSAMNRPSSVTFQDVRKLVLTYPLDRFVIQGFVERPADGRLIRIRPEVWEGLRFRDVVSLRQSLHDQLDRYYASAKG
jgi:hypothetical protein